jgi:hypothetical protein
MNLDHEELWVSVKGLALSAPQILRFAPGSSFPTLAFLDKMAIPFDRYVLLRVEVLYKPSVGTTKDGFVVIGVDWDVAGQVSTLAGAQTLLPRVRIPVWQEQRMVLPTNRLMSRRFLLCSSNVALSKDPDYGCFGLAISCNQATEVGEIWVRYRIQLSGPTGEHGISRLNGDRPPQP